MEIINNLLEAGLIFALFHFTLGEKPGERWRARAGILAVGLGMSVIAFAVSSSSLRIFLNILLLYAYAEICFRGTKTEKFFRTLSYIMAALLAERMVFQIMDFVFRIEPRLLVIPGAERQVSIILYLIFCGVFTGLLIHVDGRRSYLPDNYLAAFILAEMGIAVLMDKLTDIILAVPMKAVREDLFLLTDVMYLLFLAIAFSVLYLVIGLSRLYQERNEAAGEKMKEEYLSRRVNSMEQANSTLKKWKHDYGKHLRLIQEMLEQGESQAAERLLAELIEENTASGLGAETGDIVVDMLVGDARVKAEIHLDWDRAKLPLSEIELSSLLGNLLDNALEAAQKQEEGKRCVWFGMKTRNEFLCILVKNSYDGILRMENGILYSRKAEQGHGLGWKRIKEIVQKAGGIADTDHTEEEFRVQILLPLDKGEEKDGRNEDCSN